MTAPLHIDALFRPRNVALVGATNRPEHWSKRVWDNLIRFRFQGHVFPVNPGREELWGSRCFARLTDLPEAPDHLAIFTPAEATLEVLQQGARAGARTATLYAAGFGEGGDPHGLRLAGQLRHVLASTGITAIGPACMGVACGASAFATVPDEKLPAPAPSPVAFIAQSGAMCSSVSRALSDLDLELGYIASCGSQVGCTIGDFITYFSSVDEVTVILCYIEAIPDAAQFLEAARHARECGKTIVAVKVGGSAESRASALAHTGSLAGRTEVFDAYAQMAGIVRVPTLEDAIEAVEFLARKPLPRGRRIAAITISGAVRSLITESAAKVGAELATFSEETSTILRDTLGHKDVANPLDTKRTRTPAELAACIDAISRSPDVGTVLIADELPYEAGAERKAANLRALEGIAAHADAHGTSLALFSPLLTRTSSYGRAIRAEFPHVPFLRTTERTLRVIKALGDAGTRPLHRGPFFAPPAETDTASAWRAQAAMLRQPTALNEVESKALLRTYGISMPEERFVAEAREAERAASELGFPVVVKGVCAALPHKSDSGLVMLGLTSGEAVRAACETLHARAADAGVTLDGILLAQYIEAGTETVLGMGHDVEMGPFVMFGLGGVLVELLKDVSFAPANLTREHALAMVRATRAGKLIDGFRGRQPGDVDGLATALVNLGRMAGDMGDCIEAIDLNPVIVNAAGAFAVDALVVLKPPVDARSAAAPLTLAR